jgi:DNA repair photolyase
MTHVKVTKNNAKYDSRHDVLHVFLAPSRPYYDDEDFPGIIIKRAEDDASTVGLTILDFTKRDSAQLSYALPGYDFTVFKGTSEKHSPLTA